ncbi:hypothetical protein CALVIDRAFT_59078 [Calocera viscosa TUFC12733]|uniref:Uncharacterized protein n=1 Tax=Calocera viscosa (strain TUFC12733) TaxID=1330018 RepID=A0A167NI80_CALVF|nr:hypothetical protein CALVIDRAFT_59078 [Calocera viscosa TUFC12733]
MLTTFHGFAIWPVRYLRLQLLVGGDVMKSKVLPVLGPITGPEWYDKHNNWVRSIVPKDQLLEFNVKEGWRPLCCFLEVPIPDVPFPRTNETAEFHRYVRDARCLGLAVWASCALGIGGAWYGMEKCGGWKYLAYGMEVIWEHGRAMLA